MKKLTVAMVPIARTTFDIPLAEEVTRTVRASLQAQNIELLGPEELVIDLEAAQAVAQDLAKKEFDLLLQRSFEPVASRWSC